MNRKFLIIQGRNFGDAVVSTGLIESIGRSIPEAEITVLTRPQFREIFATNPMVSRVCYGSFPMGTEKDFSARDAWKLALSVLKLRRIGFNVVSLTGDFREHLLGWSISPRSNYGMIWQEGHPRSQLERRGMSSLLTDAASVPVTMPNIYGGMQLVAEVLGASAPALPRLYDNARQLLTHRATRRVIGFHMSASQECKMWPVANWRRLHAIARRAGFEIKAFGAPRERQNIAADLADLVDERTDINTGTLQDFFLGFSRMRAVVCLDSFSVHVANAIGVPSVMINGANRPDTMLPPGAQLVDGGEGLACAPCMNKPTCLSSGRPFRCIRDIPVERVWSALLRSLHTSC